MPSGVSHIAKDIRELARVLSTSITPTGAPAWRPQPQFEPAITNPLRFWATEQSACDVPAFNPPNVDAQKAHHLAVALALPALPATPKTATAQAPAFPADAQTPAVNLTLNLLAAMLLFLTQDR
jgi:hypothetical protein